jgi:hypothetical protein
MIQGERIAPPFFLKKREGKAPLFKSDTERLLRANPSERQVSGVGGQGSGVSNVIFWIADFGFWINRHLIRGSP